MTHLTEEQKSELRTMKWIVPCGILGGLASPILAFQLGTSVEPILIDYFYAGILGLIASIIGVYLFPSANTNHIGRSMAFALLCGLSYKLIMENAPSYFDFQQKSNEAQQLSATVTHTGKAIEEELNKGESADKDKLEKLVVTYNSDKITLNSNYNNFLTNDDQEQGRRLIQSIAHYKDTDPIFTAKLLGSVSDFALGEHPVEPTLRNAYVQAYKETYASSKESPELLASFSNTIQPAIEKADMVNDVEASFTLNDLKASASFNAWESSGGAVVAAIPSLEAAAILTNNQFTRASLWNTPNINLAKPIAAISTEDTEWNEELVNAAAINILSIVKSGVPEQNQAEVLDRVLELFKGNESNKALKRN